MLIIIEKDVGDQHQLGEKVSLIEALTEEERKTIYTMLDAFIGKKKLKDALSNVLHDVK